MIDYYCIMERIKELILKNTDIELKEIYIGEHNKDITKSNQYPICIITLANNPEISRIDKTISINNIKPTQQVESEINIIIIDFKSSASRTLKSIISISNQIKDILDNNMRLKKNNKPLVDSSRAMIQRRFDPR